MVINDNNNTGFDDYLVMNYMNKINRYVSIKNNPNNFPKLKEDSFRLIMKLKSNPELELILPQSINVQNESLLKLLENSWINDEIISNYSYLINKRSEKCSKKVYCFNSYFFEKLDQEINDKIFNIHKYKKMFEKKRRN